MIGKKINQLATELAPVSTDLTIIGDPTTGVSKKITLAQLGAIFSGAVSFYTNLAGFPATGDINVIYCAKDTQKLYLWSGSAYVEVFPSQALLDTYQLRSEKGNANGYASLDSQGKVPISQLPSSIMEYKGTWNASTNTPTLANGTGDTGDVYICNVAGTVNFGAGPITFAVGDYVIYSGTIWQRSSGAVGTVTSVAATITGNSIGITGSPVTTSGTLAFAFAGTGAQYIKGDGTLATFPTTIDQAKNLITEVYNSTGSTLTKGTVVYINGGQGNLPTVTKALASGDSTSAQTYGIVQADITNNNNGFVVVAGRLADIDTSAFSVGTQLYLSSTTAGAYTSTKQYAPAHLVYVGIIVRSHPTQGIIEVKIQNGYELDELHNVAAQTPTNNDGLFWESSTSLWKNKSLSTILGGTPVIGSGTTNFVSKFTASSTIGSSQIWDNGTSVLIGTTGSLPGIKVGIYSSTQRALEVVSTNANALFVQSPAAYILTISNGTWTSQFTNTGRLDLAGDLLVNTIDNATTDTDKFLVSDSGVIKYRTGAELLSDIGGQPSGTYVTSVGLSVPTGFAVSGSPVTSSGTLALAFDTGYSLPTIVKQNNWDTAYNTRIVTASSPLSFISNTISISQASSSTDGYLSSTDWTTFNNKQNALTNPVTGTGTTNYLPKFTGTSTIGDSAVSDNGTTVTLNSRALSGTSATFSSSVTATGLFGFALKGRSSDNYAAFGFYSNDAATRYGYIQSHSTNGGQLNITADGGAQLIMDSRGSIFNTGNLGLGVTPSSWSGAFGSVLQFKSAGSNGGGSLTGSGGSNFRMFANTFYDGSYKYIVNGTATQYEQDGYHAWYTAPSGTAGNAISFTQAMTLDASGRLGIGTTSPAERLSVAGAIMSTGGITGHGANRTTISQEGGSGAFWQSYGANTSTVGAFVLRQASSDFSVTRIPLSIDTTGAATFSSSIRANAASTIYGATQDAIQTIFTLGGQNASAQAKELYFRLTAGGTPAWTLQTAAVGTDTEINIYPNGNNGLKITYAGAATFSSSVTSPVIKLSDSTLSGAGNFEFTSEAFFGARFQSNAYKFMAGNNSTEYMRLTSTGLGIGTTSPSGRLQVNGSNTSGAGNITMADSSILNMLYVSAPNFTVGINASNGGSVENVRFYNASTTVGTISTTGSATSYNTTSDYRLKQDLKDFDGLDLLSKIKTYDYEWKADKTRSYGVIAHELQSVINYAVTGVKDGEQMQGVDYSKIVPVLIKAIQELNDKIK